MPRSELRVFRVFLSKLLFTQRETSGHTGVGGGLWLQRVLRGSSCLQGRVPGSSGLFQGTLGKVFIFHQKSFQVFPSAVWGHSLRQGAQTPRNSLRAGRARLQRWVTHLICEGWCLTREQPGSLQVASQRTDVFAGLGAGVTFCLHPREQTLRYQRSR